MHLGSAGAWGTAPLRLAMGQLCEQEGGRKPEILGPAGAPLASRAGLRAPMHCALGSGTRLNNKAHGLAAGGLWWWWWWWGGGGRSSGRGVNYEKKTQNSRLSHKKKEIRGTHPPAGSFPTL
jgi:hypothetical protein